MNWKVYLAIGIGALILYPAILIAVGLAFN